MTEATPGTDLHLRAELMQHLAGIAPNLTGGHRVEGPGAFTYGCVSRERLSRVTMPHPVLGIVLRGTKEVWLGDSGVTLPAGTVFALPRGVQMDVLNIPDSRSGHYQSLLIEVADLPPGVAPLTPEESHAPARLADFAIPLTRDLVNAIGNARRDLADPEAKAAICQHRIADILLLLRRSAPARVLFHQTLSDRVRWLVRADPTADWTVDTLAARFGMAGSTLRRHLGREGAAVRGLVRAARMDAAHDALLRGAPAGVAVELAGYASRSHFARRFRETYGINPSAVGSGA